MVLLDTDIMIDLLRKHPPAIAWLGSLDDEEIALPSFVMMELIQGCRNKVEQKKIEKILKPFSMQWPVPETCDEALSVFSRYHLSHSLGLLDALIGQTAVALGVPLHTFNQKHYAPIPKLITVRPYKRKVASGLRNRSLRLLAQRSPAWRDWFLSPLQRHRHSRPRALPLFVFCAR